MSAKNDGILQEGWDASSSKKRRNTINAEELVIMEPKKRKTKEGEGSGKKKKELVDRVALKAAKADAKRLRILKEKKSAQEERSEILERLQKVQRAEDSKYLKSSAKLGQARLTKREALRRALNEEKAGLERSQPEVALYEERDQVIDFTAVRAPQDTGAQEFIDEHAHLLAIKKPKKKKKVKTAEEANPTRSLKRKMFSVVESSSEDSEGDTRRKALKSQHANDSDGDELSSESSISDISSSSDSKETKQSKGNKKQTATPSTISTATSTALTTSSHSVLSSSHVTSSSNTSTTVTKPSNSSSSGFVIPSFTSIHRTSKTKLTTASSTKRAQDRRLAAASKTLSDDLDQDSENDASDDDSHSEQTSSATKSKPASSASSSRGFIIPDFSKKATKATSSNGEAQSASSGSGSESSDEGDNDNAMEVDLVDEEMKRRHGLTPARDEKSFLEDAPTFDRPSLSALDAPVPEEQRKKAADKTTRYFVQIQRKPEIDEARRKLPIVMEEFQIMETIRDNDFVIICGETGSGKTTQVPQFLYEAGYGDPKSKTPGIIGVTEPRRVAAISTAQRVAVELNQDPPGLEAEPIDANGQTSTSNPNNSGTSSSSSSSLPASKSKGNTKSPSSTNHVGYQVRYDVTSDKNTRIKFMTDGILLREIQSDFLLNRYSVIIIDEAHERTLNTDLLLGLLCRLVPLRNQMFSQGSPQVQSPLKVVIMSATLRVSDFVSNQRMFPTVKPPVIKIGARQFPVTVHFNRHTSLDNYVTDAYKKVVKIHTRLPEGGILVFLAGQAEIIRLVHLLRKRFNNAGTSVAETEEDKEFFKIGFDPSGVDDFDAEDDEDESEESLEDDLSVSYEKGSSSEDSSGSGSSGEGSGEEDDSSIDLDAALTPKLPKRKKIASHSSASSESEEEGEKSSNKMDVDGEGGDKEGEGEKKKKKRKKGKLDESEKLHLNDDMNVVVMPLYSMLPPKDQMRIFGSLPPRTRLIVVATNIAETSLTIPGITYVVDAGRVKSKVYDKASGMTSYQVDWTSRASADQRAGRAGRTGPGHCYRLFSSAVYQRFPEFTRPDILNIPIEGVVLQMKQIGVDHLAAFPFPTPPDPISLENAHRTLVHLGALEKPEKDDETSTLKITPLGRALVHFPVSPRYAKMLIIAHQSDCLPWIVAIVAALAVGDPFEHAIEKMTSDPRQKLWAAWSSSTSDLLVWLAAIGAYEYATDQEDFCEKYKLHFKTLKEIRLLREQLNDILSVVFTNDSLESTDAHVTTLEEDLDAEEMALQAKIGEEQENQTSKSFNHSAKAKQTKKRKAKFESKLAKPSKEQNLQLRQIIASGLLDQVAKRYPKLDEHGVVMKNRWVYRTATALKECMIHPNSFLRSSPPEYVAYNELIETHESFICGVTAISMGWMSALGPWLCKQMDVVLATPKPRFDASLDTIIGAVEPYYFHPDWIVPKLMIPLQGLDLYKHFARSMLEGEVFQALKPFQPFLTANPEIILTVWTQPKIGALVQPLMDKKIKTKAHLEAIWREKDSTFLLSAFALWINKNKHAALKAIWPPLSKK